jgi:hypothetical protein
MHKDLRLVTSTAKNKIKVWGFMPIIPALERLTQKDYKF